MGDRDSVRSNRLESFDVTDLLTDMKNDLISANDRSTATRSKARAIPAAAAPDQPQQSQSAASSQGSSGSAFLSSVLNPNGLSHTPPAPSSYEASHFGKRPRSGSLSGRLRSASEYLEEKGLLDDQTKGILKDLIIIGDEELQEALDNYERGDPSALEDMIQSGALQNRLPQDLDILGDLDLDFLTMDDMEAEDNVVAIPSQQHVGKLMPPPSDAASAAHQLQQLQHHHPNTVSPPYDDGIGELEFAGEFVSDQTADYSNVQLQQTSMYTAKDLSCSGQSPTEQSNVSEYERRMRSNSLFSALLNDPRGKQEVQASNQDEQYGQWMDCYPTQSRSYNRSGGISISKSKTSNRRGRKTGALAKSIELDRKKREKAEKKEQKKQERLEKKEKKRQEEEAEEHVPGSGKPHRLTDSNLRFFIDGDGLQDCERPDGWIGAYSPGSRKVRIGRFLEKRNHRVWVKSVKYDVRKNFADSRLRVKGRFVKKEEESLMRELMSLT